MIGTLPGKFGKYWLLQRIAIGGMAELFKAKVTGEEGFEKLIAIKTILPHLSHEQDLITMFIDEAKFAALLSHQNIVQVYDFGKEEGVYYIAMEYLQGKDLRAILQKARDARMALPWEYALHIISRVCSGLDYLHNLKDLKGNPLNLIHRDISPQNIFITYLGEVKLLDFGIAKAASRYSGTRVGVLKGKVSYMSPEQAAGQPLDKRSDIFSTGVVLYEMISGKKMFHGETMKVLEQVRKAEFEPLETVVPNLPSELYAIFHRALTRNPEDRFHSCNEMLRAIDNCLMAISARQSSENLSTFVSDLFAEDIAAEALAPDSEALSPEPAGLSSRDAEKTETLIEETRLLGENRPGFRERFQRDKKLWYGSALAILVTIFAGFALISRFSPTEMSGISSPSVEAPQPHAVMAETEATPQTSPIQEEPLAGQEESPVLPKPGDLDEALAALNAEDFDKALTLIEELLANDPDLLSRVSGPYAHAMVGKGISLAATDPQLAADLFERATIIDPGSARGYFELGKLYTRMEDYSGAIESYTKAAVLNPDSADTFFNLGFLYATIEDYARAEEMFLKVVEMSPPYLDEAYFNLAMMQMRQARLDDGIQSLRRSLAINPQNERAARYLERLKKEG